MINQAHKLASFGRPAPVSAPTPFFRRVGSATAAFFRATWQVIRITADIRNELQRMADEVESTCPEQAARLRKLATSHWGE